jgi:membrane-bound lytic murein transglycosylase B
MTPRRRPPLGRPGLAGLLTLLTLLLCLAAPLPAAATWAGVIERLAGDGFDRPALEALFARPEVCFETDAMAGKIQALLRSRAASEAEIEARKTAVRRDYLAPAVIARAKAYKTQNGALLDEVARLYGVPKEIVVSILLIETRLGEYTGERIVFNRLASMAGSADLEGVLPHLGKVSLSPDDEAFARRRSREKADWAYDELKALLRYAEQHGADPLAIRGSVYGAIGQCQFMPSNIFIYGVDADRDGRIDPFSTADALHSIANYLRGYGWRAGLSRQEQQRVIFGYNHSTIYANTVLAIADRLKARKGPRP